MFPLVIFENKCPFYPVPAFEPVRGQGLGPSPKNGENKQEV